MTTISSYWIAGVESLGAASSNHANLLALGVTAPFLVGFACLEFSYWKLLNQLLCGATELREDGIQRRRVLMSLRGHKWGLALNSFLAILTALALVIHAAMIIYAKHLGLRTVVIKLALFEPLAAFFVLAVTAYQWRALRETAHRVEKILNRTA